MKHISYLVGGWGTESPAKGQLEPHRLPTSKEFFLQSNRNFVQDSFSIFSTENTTFLPDHYDLISSGWEWNGDSIMKIDTSIKGKQDTFELRKGENVDVF